jgi:diguanylate cyclase
MVYSKTEAGRAKRSANGTDFELVGYYADSGFGVLYRVNRPPGGEESSMESRNEAPRRMSRKRTERLSEVIIDTLKTLSTQQEKLTPGALSEALREREDFWVLLQGNGKAPAEPLTNKGNEASSTVPPPALSTQTEADSGITDADPSSDTPDDHPGLSEFYKKSILTLIALAQETDNKSLSDSLEQFRLSIAGDGNDLEALGKSLQQIKNIIMKEEPDASTESRPRGASSFWSFWQRRSKAAKDDTPSEDVGSHLQRLQNALLTIANEMQFGLGADDPQRVAELKGRFESSTDLGSLLEPAEDLIGFIQAYIRQAAQQRDEVASFVKELGAALLEMESQLLTSLAHTQETYQFNSEFNISLHGQLEDINESFNISRSLDEARSFVLAKLKTLKAALENKRKQDESYLQNANEKMGDLQKGFQKMKKEIGQVHKKTKILEQEVLLDSLTGIYNRRAYELRIREELSRYHRYNQPFSLVLFDVDRFKKVNDHYGHQAGDKCLREITGRIKPSLRHCDFLARYGGEEFVMILPGTTEDDAYKAAEKIRNLVEKTRFVYQGAEVPVTISLGLTQVKPTDQEPDTLFKRVDNAMYQAKKEGRNRTHRL